jgi:transposase InsO family protein
MREFVKEKKVQERYDEEFKRQAVELVIHSGKTQAQIAREPGVSVCKPLRVIGANLSMSRVGNWEAFFSTLETEGFPDNQFFPSRVQARREIFEYIEVYYNNQRLHSALGCRAPCQHETQFK